MTNRLEKQSAALSMTWMWLALFRLTLTLVMGYAFTRALQERLAAIVGVFQELP